MIRKAACCRLKYSSSSQEWHQSRKVPFLMDQNVIVCILVFRVDGTLLAPRHVDNCVFCLSFGVSCTGFRFVIVADSRIPHSAGIYRAFSVTVLLGRARRVTLGLCFLVGVSLPPYRNAHLPPYFWLTVSHPSTGSLHPRVADFQCGFPAFQICCTVYVTKWISLIRKAP